MFYPGLNNNIMIWFFCFLVFFFSAKMAFQVEGETIGDLQQTLDDIRKQELDLINAAKSKSMEDLQRIETTTQSS